MLILPPSSNIRPKQITLPALVSKKMKATMSTKLPVRTYNKKALCA